MRMMRGFLLVGAALLATLSAANARTVTINWSDPVARVGGAPLPAAQIGGVQILDGGTQIGQCAGACTTFTTPNLPAGTHTFTVIILDTSTPPLASIAAPSPAISIVVPQSPPNPATGVTATLNADPPPSAPALAR